MSESRRDLVVTLAWVTALALLLLGPALAPGYVLSYDMVWFPDLAMRPDFFGSGSNLPRAVPSDAVVALVDEVIPGMLLQKSVLLGSLIGAGCGAAALVRRLPLVAQLAAATVAVWNPFVVERLVLGHWPVLIGYAVLPWLLLAGRRSREHHRLDPWLLGLAPLGCLSASAGLVTAVAVLLSGLSGKSGSSGTSGLSGGPTRARFNGSVIALVLAANAPWLVAGIAHGSAAVSDPAGAEVFATRAEGWLPAPLAALGLGGIWNSEVVPPTREGILAVLALVGLIALVVVGWRSWWPAADRRERIALVGCWAIGGGLAVLSWAATDLIAWTAGEVPGGGLLRDGTRLLGLCVPLLVVLVGHATHQIATRWDGVKAVGVGLVLAPVALMPDAAWGAGGDLRAVPLPDSYAEAHALLARQSPDGDLLLLPFSSYRAPTWNHGHKVVDPLGRALPMDYVTDDRLLVGDVQLEGEDRRAREVGEALALGTAQRRTQALLDLGISVIAIDPGAPGEVPRLTGKVIFDRPEVRLVSLGRPSETDDDGWVAAQSAAWVAFVAPLFGGVVLGLRRRLRRDR